MLTNIVRAVERILGDHLGLLRAEAKEDLRELAPLLMAALLGPLLICAALGLVALGLALALGAWIPLPLSLLGLGALLGTAGWLLQRRSVQQLRGSLIPPTAEALLAEMSPPAEALPPAEAIATEAIATEAIATRM